MAIGHNCTRAKDWEDDPATPNQIKKIIDLTTKLKWQLSPLPSTKGTASNMIKILQNRIKLKNKEKNATR